MKAKTQGIALVVTLVLALVLFIAIVAITTTLSIGNRQTASNQGVAVRAQFSAESGLNQADQKLVAVASLLNNMTVDLGNGGSYVAAQAALFQDMYRFCYGDPASPPSGTPVDFNTFALNLSNNSSNPNYTICSAANPINTSDSDAVIATNRMQIFMDSSNGGYIPFGAAGVADLVRKIDNRSVTGTSPNLGAEQTMWANMARGGSFAQSLSSTGGYRDSFSTAVTLAPVSLAKVSGSYVFTMGKPSDTSAGVLSTGLVQATDGTSVANRILTRSSLMSTSLQPPNFARFAFFYNSHYLNATKSDTTSVVKIRSGFKVTGPMFTNGNYVFESNASPAITLAGEAGSAGCDDGAGTFYGNGTAVTGTPTAGISTNSGCTQRSTGNKWSGTPQQGYYLDGKSTYVPLATATQATSFNSSLNLDTVYQDDQGNQLCGTVTREYYGLNKCSDTYSGVVPDSAKARSVNWNHAPIPLPTDGTVAFNNNAASGGLWLDAANYSSVGNQGTTYTGLTVPGGLIVPALDVTHSAAVGQYTGTPTVKLSVDNPTSASNQVQHMQISVTQITSYTLSFSSSCYTPPAPSPSPTPTPTPNPPGDPGAYLSPSPSQSVRATVKRGHGENIWMMVGQLLTAGNTANAAGVFWTVPAACAFDPASQRYSYTWSRQTATRTMDVQVNRDKTVSVVSSSFPNPNTAFTLNTTSFNGVIYSSSALNLDSGSDQADQSNPTVAQKATRNLPEVANYSQLSVTAGDTVYIKHDITYAENPIGWTDTSHKPTNMLGIYAGNNVWFNSGNKTSSTRYQDFNLSGVVMAQNGSVGNYDACNTNTSNVDKGTLNIIGSVIQNRLGPINCKFTGRAVNAQPGYTGNYQYDQRTGDGLTPPSFPSFTAGSFTASNNFTTNRSFIRVVPGN